MLVHSISLVLKGSKKGTRKVKKKRDLDNGPGFARGRSGTGAEPPVHKHTVAKPPEQPRSGSISRRNWASASIRDMWSSHSDVFQESGREDDGEELKWAAIERLPTYDLLKRGMLKQVLDNGRVEYEEIDLTNLGVQDKQHLMERILQVVEEDNKRLLYRLRERTDR